MDIRDLTDGLYVLTRDVLNPHPDRRKRRDWTAEPMWAAGAEFTVRTWVDADINPELPMYCAEISHANRHVGCAWWGGGESNSRSHEKAVALVAALEPVAIQSVEQALGATRRPYMSRDWQAILEYVIEHGGVSLAVVHDALVLESRDKISSDGGVE